MSSQKPINLEVAVAALQQGDGAKVVSVCKKLLKRQPDEFDVLHLMGIGYRLQGRLDQAVRFYQHALNVKPEGSATLFCNLAFAHLGLPNGSVFQAFDYAAQARKLAPDLAEAYEVSTEVMLRTGDGFAAEAYIQRAIDLQPDNPKLLIKASRLYRRTLRLDRALATVQRAVTVSGRSSDVYRELGDVHELRGETEESIDAYLYAIDLNQHIEEELNQKIIGVLSTHGRKKELRDRALNLLERDSLNPNWHIALLRAGEYPGGVEKGIDALGKLQKSRRPITIEAFAIGQGFDKEKKFQDAFKYFKKGNKLKEQTQDYTIEKTRTEYARIRDFFSSQLGSQFPIASGENDDFPTPIFIVGMPRSGTSLTEQLLGSHSEIHAAGELQTLLSLVKFGNRHFQNHRKQHTLEYWRWVRETYLSSLSELSGGKRFVTDKMPHNFEMIGFICELFPDAIIVHAKRDPISNCLSIFKTNFMGYHPYAQDLRTLGLYFGEYRKLMSYWQNNYGPRIFDSEYEKLVTETKPAVENILKRCGLEWEDEIDSFHESERIVRTASIDQVRQPVYQSSLKSWKKYSEQLGPLINALLAAKAISESDLE
ncbi:MAG: sulfotransferase [Pseudomonadales bacterium]|nr:sulfotransferase [Pseudomonadales bacterium]